MCIVERTRQGFKYYRFDLLGTFADGRAVYLETLNQFFNVDCDIFDFAAAVASTAGTCSGRAGKAAAGRIYRRDCNLRHCGGCCVGCRLFAF